MIRATTIGVLKTYRNNLNNSFSKMNSARETFITHRVFNSYAEDPAAAARAFQLRRSRMAVESQHTVNDATYRKFQSAWSSIDRVVKDVDNETKNSVEEAALRALNDPTGDARAALGKELNELADTIVQTMNNKYGDSFIFSGADGQTVPFSWGEKGELLYRGVPVDASLPVVVQDGEGNAIKVDANGAYDPAGTNYLRGETFLATVDQLETNPPLLKYPNGDRVVANGAGELTTSTDPAGLYVDLSKTKLISGSELANLPAGGPNVLRDSGHNPITFNANGEIDPDGDRYLLIHDGNNSAAVTPGTETVVGVLKDAAGNPVMFDADGKMDPAGTYYMTTDETEVLTQAEYDEACENVAKLKYLSGESYYVDIGLGFKENSKDELIKSSGFNAALQGINYLGYGMDEDGDPNNIVTLIKQMAKVCTEGGGKLSDAEYAELKRLTGKLENASAELQNKHTALDASTGKLENNAQLLEESYYTLQEQYSGLEDVDDAEAISIFLWASYSYNAALRVGNSILSQSLMDYVQ